MLKVREVREFEAKAGMPFAQAAKKLQVRLCSTHRLLLKNCQECARTGGCAEHRQAASECDACGVANVPVEAAAALVWILRRRTEPDLTYEEVEEMDYAEMGTLLGELVATAREGANGSGGSPLSLVSTG